MMKRVLIFLLLTGMVFGAATGASAIDFKVKGQWLMGFGVGDGSFINKQRDDANKTKANTNDRFVARQRLRMQLNAVASENLSGTVNFEIGNQKWGQARQGGALGADGNNIIKVKHAYLDWTVPQTDLKLRMGIQGVTLPNKAGGPAVLDSDVAGITAAYQFNETVGLTALWLRPLNDNYTGTPDGRKGNYLDNMDLFALTLPLKFDGFEITPWAMYGIAGKNLQAFTTYNGFLNDGNIAYTLAPYPALGTGNAFRAASKPYGNMFWAGLPFAITALAPWNIEFDINYGYVESLGRYTATNNSLDTRRSSSERSGWLAKALVEYKMDWGTPGIFGWYGSGDDGNPKNGSERMPSVVPYGNFTSFMGDGPMGWTSDGSFFDINTSYAGTWGIGARVKDLSFIEDLKHTLTVAYWGGTNSTSIVKYMDSAHAWNTGVRDFSLEGPYMTTKDGLLEVNVLNSWQIYENLKMDVELGYMANFMDHGTWRKSNARNSSFEKQDAWKASVVFAYSF